MMKKLLASAVLAGLSLSALAQTSYNYYKFEDTPWNVSARMGITYNLVGSVPEGMSRSGLGLDFCIMEGQYCVTRRDILSLGLLDLQIDFRYLQKGMIFSSQPIGEIYKAAEDSRAKAHLTDFVFSFPFGYTHRFNSRLAASAYVAPGVGLIRYSNNVIEGDVQYKDSFYPVRDRAGFRLDLKAVLWFEDLGLMVRYQPIGFNSQKTFSIGLALCY